ncbi:MAG: M10 family metallopeptidase C-terminal domain-containing protein [Cyanobacteriota bacterium]
MTTSAFNEVISPTSLDDSSLSSNTQGYECGCLLCQQSLSTVNEQLSSSLFDNDTLLNDGNRLGNDLVSPLQDASQPYYVNALLPTGERRWNSTSPTGTPVTLTYSFMTAMPSYYGSNPTWTNFTPFTQEQKQQAREALRLWSDVANINFVEVSDAGAGGTIRFGYAAPNFSANGWAYYPSTHSSGGDVWLNRTSATDLTPGSWGFGTLIHEIGHALGLKHTFDAGVATLPTSEDTYQYSNMSYTQHPDMLGVRPRTPQLYDIAAIQYLYGANTNTRSGNDTYSWATNATFVQTIWDGAGIDTISAANQVRDAVINLQPGSFSSIGARGSANAKNNLAIAFNVTIENAIAGLGNDTLTGNTANNLLQGGAGNDFLYGEAGNDTLSGEEGNDYLNAGDSNDTLSGGDGNDTLIGGAGDDNFSGGSGNDTYIADSTADIIIEYANAGMDTVESSISYTLAENLENLTLIGTDALNGYGNALDNIILGNSANNLLSGDSGNDSLRGGLGSDTLTGGMGADYFTFYSVTQGIDIITDFASLEGDKLLISASGFGGGLTIGNLADDWLTLGSTAIDENDRFIFDSSTGALFFDGDGIGATAQVQLATLSVGLSLSSTDFSLIA